jgi:hypothetical protein
MYRVAAGFLAVGFLAVTVAVSSGAAGSTVAPQERAQARQALLVLSDFPKGWTSTPSSSSDSSLNSSPGITANAQMARCLGVSPSSFQYKPPQVQSPTFTDPAGTVNVGNSILVFRSTSFAHNEYAALASPKAAGCLQAQLEGQESTGTTFGPPPRFSLEKLPGPKGTVSFEISSPLQGTMGLSLVFSFFSHQQFGDLVVAFSYRSGTNVHPLAQRLLDVAHSRL